MQFLSHRVALLAVVFIMGLCILAMELVANRLLSTYFGGTIYTLSSVLSIILGALSAGYYIGGKLGDARPNATWFYGVIYVGGLTCLLMQTLTVTLLPSISGDLDTVSGPIIASLILFFIPSVILGTTSPYAIAVLNEQTRQGAGRISGTVFLWSTLGSIAGSLLTGYVLVTLMGLNSILISVAAAITLIGAMGISGQWRKRSVRLLYAGGAVAWLLWFAFISPIGAGSSVVYSGDGVYQRITIFDETYQNQPTRFLFLDKNASSAAREGSDDLVFIYTKYAKLLPELRPDARTALVVGGGNYSIPVYLRSKLPEATVHVSEIEPSLYELSKRHFWLKDDPKLINHIADGRRILNDGRKYDIIFGDAFGASLTIPSHLTTKQYFDEIKSSLTDNGIYMMNAIGNHKPDYPSFVLSEIKTFRQAFPNMYLFATDSPDKEEALQNYIFVGVNGDRQLKPEDGLLTAEALTHQLDVNKLNLARHRSFTDNFAPTDYYLAFGVTKQ